MRAQLCFHLERGSFLSVLGAAIAIPLSTTATDITTITAFVLCVLSGNYAEKLGKIRRSPACLVSILLFLCYVVGTAYSSANTHEALKLCLAYRRLLFIPVYVVILATPYRRTKLFQAAQISLFMTLAASYLVYFGVLSSWGYDHPVYFKIHMAHTFLLTFWLAILLYSQANSPWKNRLRWVLILLVLLDIYVIVFSRTGYVLCTVLLVFWLFDHFGWKKTLICGIPLVAIVLGSLFFLSPKFEKRMQQTVDRMRQFSNDRKDENAEKAPKLSYGNRLEIWYGAERTIAKRPFFGYGTGGIKPAYTALQDYTKKYRIPDDPHNEYLAVSIQLGLIGLVLFLIWLFTLYRTIGFLPYPQNRMWLLLLLLFTIDGFLNSVLINHTEGHFFVLFAGCFIAAALDAKQQTASDHDEKIEENKEEENEEENQEPETP